MTGFDAGMKKPPDGGGVVKLGSGIFDPGNTQAAATQPGGFIAELKRFGAGLELIGEG
jgi:hypothetical protein